MFKLQVLILIQLFAIFVCVQVSMPVTFKLLPGDVDGNESVDACDHINGSIPKFDKNYDLNMNLPFFKDLFENQANFGYFFILLDWFLMDFCGFNRIGFCWTLMVGFEFCSIGLDWIGHENFKKSQL